MRPRVCSESKPLPIKQLVCGGSLSTTVDVPTTAAYMMMIERQTEIEDTENTKNRIQQNKKIGKQNKSS